MLRAVARWGPVRKQKKSKLRRSWVVPVMLMFGPGMIEGALRVAFVVTSWPPLVSGDLESLRLTS